MPPRHGHGAPIHPPPPLLPSAALHTLEATTISAADAPTHRTLPLRRTRRGPAARGATRRYGQPPPPPSPPPSLLPRESRLCVALTAGAAGRQGGTPRREEAITGRAGEWGGGGGRQPMDRPALRVRSLGGGEGGRGWRAVNRAAATGESGGRAATRPAAVDLAPPCSLGGAQDASGPRHQMNGDRLAVGEPQLTAWAHVSKLSDQDLAVRKQADGRSTNRHTAAQQVRGSGTLLE